MDTSEYAASSYEVTTATSEDLRSIVDLEEAVSLKKYPNVKLRITEMDVAAIGWGEERAVKYQERFLDNPTAGLWVIKQEDEVVGFTAANNNAGEDDAWLRKLYVALAYQHRGLGSRLLARAESWIGADSDIKVGVASYDVPALEFYQRRGYGLLGPRPLEETTVPATGTIIPELLLIKRAHQRTQRRGYV